MVRWSLSVDSSLNRLNESWKLTWALSAVRRYSTTDAVASVVEMPKFGCQSAGTGSRNGHASYPESVKTPRKGT